MAITALPCDRCGRPLAPGAPRYVMSLELTSDFDGFLPEPAPGETPASLLAELDALSQDEIEAEVHQAFAFTLCPACRALIAANPLQRPGGDPSGGRRH